MTTNRFNVDRPGMYGLVVVGWAVTLVPVNRAVIDSGAAVVYVSAHRSSASAFCISYLHILTLTLRAA